MPQPEEDRNDAIMQRRIAGENQRQGGERRHVLPANEEPTGEHMDQRHVPGADRIAGRTRWRREPYPGEVVGGRREPPFEVVGLDALSPLLVHVDFPTTREAVIERIGEVRVPVTKLRAKTVREVLEQVTPTEFATSQDLENAVRRVWDKIAEREGRGSRHSQVGDTSARPVDTGRDWQ